MAVVYPASFKAEGKVRSSSGKPHVAQGQMTATCNPWRMGYRPVIRLARVGEQTGCT